MKNNKNELLKTIKNDIKTLMKLLKIVLMKIQLTTLKKSKKT